MQNETSAQYCVEYIQFTDQSDKINKADVN